MQSRIRLLWLGALCVSCLSVNAVAQVGDVLDDAESGGGEGSEPPGAARITASERAASHYADEEEERPDEGWDGMGHPTMDYNVGKDLPIEVGGHLLASFFATPNLPALNTGLGFQGRIATPVYGDFVGEGNVGIMFNPDQGGQATYKTATLRVGGRYPIDVGANPVLFFLGAGVALDVFWVTTVTTTGMELSKSAIAPAGDVQFGVMWELSDRFAVEAIAQGSYAFSHVVFSNKDSSWISILGGVSYDL